MTDFLAEKKNEIKQRVDELRPYVEEAALLQAALAALDNQPKRRGRPRKTGVIEGKGGVAGMVEAA